MNLATTAPGWLTLFLMFSLVMAAAEDAWRLRISNITCLLILAAAILAAILVGPQLALWQNIALVAGLLALGTPLFAAGKMGGGDVKLIAASGAWFDLYSGLLMLLFAMLAGGLLAFIILFLRLFEWPENARKRVRFLTPGSGIPYGVAIAAGSLLVTSLSLA